MPQLTMVQALNLALDQSMASDPDVLCMGQDIAVNGGVFRVTKGLLEKYGEKRVRDTQLAECGIVGTAGFREPEHEAACLAAIQHRGPDGEGAFRRENLFLGMRRLAILDPERGRQPATSEDGRVQVVYNGEIYNAPALAHELEKKGHRLASGADTEILPHLYEEEGIEGFRRLEGMFAFALWDERERSLWLVRDPVGIKPLFWWEDGKGRLAFASELKALLCLDALPRATDPDAAHLLLNLRYVPGERTLLRGVRKIAPGEALRWQDGRIRRSNLLALDDSPEGKAAPDATERLREALEVAVRRQLRSDVPLGTFLSGGFDSSLITTLAARSDARASAAFTLAFGEPTDETDDARAVADACGIPHRTETLVPDLDRQIPEVLWHTESPSVNAVQGYALARFASREVKVALSGLGADELFKGYEIHRRLEMLRMVRAGGAGMLAPLARWAERAWRRWGGPLAEVPQRALGAAARTADPLGVYLLLRNAWEEIPALAGAIYTGEAARAVTVHCREPFEPFFRAERDPLLAAARAEFRTKMVDDFLVNEDRNSMAHGLEARVPFLDQGFLRAALAIPWAERFRGEPKRLLREAARPLLPPATLSKPKHGFANEPFFHLERGLSKWWDTALARDRIERDGRFRWGFVDRIRSHRPDRRLRWHYFLLWLIAGLLDWEEMFVHPTPEAFRRSVLDRAGKGA